MATKGKSRARRAKQADLFPSLLSYARAGFGGAGTQRSHPTKARPFSPRAPLHVVMRSERARGDFSLLRYGRRVEKILAGEAARVGGKLYDLANSGNHLHLVVRLPSPTAMRRFMRASSGLIAREVLGAKKGTPSEMLRLTAKSSVSVQPVPRGRATRSTRSANKATERRTASDTRPSQKPRFWDARPFSRIVSWGPDYNGLKRYFQLNRNEGALAGQTRAASRAMLAAIEKLGLATFGPAPPGTRFASTVTATVQSWAGP